MMRCAIRVSLCLMLLLGLELSCRASASASGDLAKNFASPPAWARPWVYWFWLNGNITREGIRLDLEAMKRAGVGGVLIMEVDQGAPLGPVDFAGPHWRDLFRYVIQEAHRLGLQVNMNDDAGWNGSGGPWITPDRAMEKVVWSETSVEGPSSFDAPLPQPPTVHSFYRDISVMAFPTPAPFRIPDLEGKSGLVRRDIPPQARFDEPPAGAVIAEGQVRDLTPQMEGGRLRWQVPPGHWTILRMGATLTGAVNAPAPASGRGLECDKLSPEGSEAAFNGFMAKLIADNSPYVGSTLVRTHIDSWENGSQNWTPRFAEEFRRLRGYDLHPYLPVFAGHVVGSREVSERFLWDVRQTISDLLVEHYAGHMAQLAKRHGIRLSIEAYGDCVFDDMTYAGRADEPMAEFWSWPGNFTSGIVSEMASAAHIYGKPILGAEAFTAGDGEKWLYHPASVKPLGDWAFCRGVNRFVIHRYALQPWRDRRPGMSMGPWGLHYERTQTWWEQSLPWHRYLARCQYLLQQGLPVADLLYLEPEGAPRSFSPPTPTTPGGYRADACTPEALFTRVRVVQAPGGGRVLALPNGVTYQALVLPSTPVMTPRLLRRIGELAKAGALIVAGPPPTASPSLSGYPGCDSEVRSLAQAIWSSGRIVTGRTPDQVLAKRGIVPDFRSNRLLDYIHKRIGSTDVYFVANESKHAVNAVCFFRVTAGIPELWDAETGSTEIAPVYRHTQSGTRVDLRLEAGGSVFVVFRAHRARPAAITRILWNGKDLSSVHAHAPQIEILRALWGPAGDAARTKDVTDQVRRMLQQGRDAFQVAELAAEGDPAVNVVKTLRVDYRVASKERHVEATDPETITFEHPSDAAPPLELCRTSTGAIMACIQAPGKYTLVEASGRRIGFIVPAVPRPIPIEGPWLVRFPPGWGAPPKIVLDRLMSWSEHPVAGVRYFSGTAAYFKTFTIPEKLLVRGRRLILDLGDVEVIAQVRLNGHDLPILWKPPFHADITRYVRPGINRLEIAVTNLWPNRMIGDEELPEDSARNPNGTLKYWPDWLLAGKPSPTGRFTFTTWRLWHKGSPLVPSGLLGPVTIRIQPVRELGRTPR
ncbi:MAG: glycosyl hydrolase [Chthonomonadales bacterium]